MGLEDIEKRVADHYNVLSPPLNLTFKYPIVCIFGSKASTNALLRFRKITLKDRLNRRNSPRHRPSHSSSNLRTRYAQHN